MRIPLNAEILYAHTSMRQSFALASGKKKTVCVLAALFVMAARHPAGFRRGLLANTQKAPGGSPGTRPESPSRKRWG
jgi:hypothetical protein